MDVEAIAKDVADNFYSITGVTVDSVVNPTSEVYFNHDMIEQTFPDIESYIKENYGVEPTNSTELLRKIDDEIINKTYFN
jgi:hypothetical protein